MSFTVSTIGRRPRGLGTGPFMSEMTARAGEAIGTAIMAGRAVALPEIQAQITADVPLADRGPIETDIPDEIDESELDCECLAKRAIDAAVNISGADPADAAAIFTVGNCEEDPALFAEVAFSLGADLDAACAWYELPRRRLKYLAIAAGVVVVAGGGLYLMRRR